MESVAGTSTLSSVSSSRIQSTFLMFFSSFFGQKFAMCSLTDQTVSLNLNFIWEENFLQIENMGFHFFLAARSRKSWFLLFPNQFHCDNLCFAIGQCGTSMSWKMVIRLHWQFSPRPVSTMSKVIFTRWVAMRMNHFVKIPKAFPISRNHLNAIIFDSDFKFQNPQVSSMRCKRLASQAQIQNAKLHGQGKRL